MRKFKSIALMLVIIMTTALVGCGDKSPTDVVDEYLSKVTKGNTDVKELFSLTDSEEGQNEAEDDSFSEETAKKLLEKVKGITYNINSESIEGDNAKVNVTVKGMDLNIVFGKVMQEAMGYIFTQAFSGKEMTEEESNVYMDSLFNKYLDEVTYSERTLDISLNKVDNEWKINENDTLAKLLLGIDSSDFEETN